MRIDSQLFGIEASFHLIDINGFCRPLYSFAGRFVSISADAMVLRESRIRLMLIDIESYWRRVDYLTFVIMPRCFATRWYYVYFHFHLLLHEI